MVAAPSKTSCLLLVTKMCNPRDPLLRHEPCFSVGLSSVCNQTHFQSPKEILVFASPRGCVTLACVHKCLPSVESTESKGGVDFTLGSLPCHQDMSGGAWHTADTQELFVEQAFARSNPSLNDRTLGELYCDNFKGDHARGKSQLSALSLRAW